MVFVAGHFGEWLQGLCGPEGRVALVTLACPVAGVHAALAGLATGAVLSSRTVRLRRGVEGADARRRAGVVSQAPEEIARTPRSR